MAPKNDVEAVQKAAKAAEIAAIKKEAAEFFAAEYQDAIEEILADTADVMLAIQEKAHERAAREILRAFSEAQRGERAWVQAGISSASHDEPAEPDEDLRKSDRQKYKEQLRAWAVAREHLRLLYERLEHDVQERRADLRLVLTDELDRLSMSGPAEAKSEEAAR